MMSHDFEACRAVMAVHPGGQAQILKLSADVVPADADSAGLLVALCMDNFRQPLTARPLKRIAQFYATESHN